MPDAQNRLCKLIRESKTYEKFKAEAVRKSSWYLGPYAQAGQRIDKPWLETFWKTHKGGK